MSAIMGHSRHGKAALWAGAQDPRFRIVISNNFGSAINQDKMPALHKPVIKDIGYHIRAGEHDVTEYDWSCYLDFADKLFEINNGMHPKNNANHRIDPHF